MIKHYTRNECRKDDKIILFICHQTGPKGEEKCL